MKLPEKYNGTGVKGPEDVARIFRTILDTEHPFDQDKEHFWVMGMSTKNRIKYIDLVTLGTLNYSPIHPREAFRVSILHGVSSIILVHNHPSGDPEPSEEDRAITTRLQDAGKIIGIEVLDHVIVASDHYTSLKNLGLM